MNTNQRVKETLFNEAHKNGYTYISEFNNNVVEYLINKVKRTLEERFYIDTEEEINLIIDNVKSEKITILDEIFNPYQM